MNSCSKLSQDLMLHICFSLVSPTHHWPVSHFRDSPCTTCVFAVTYTCSGMFALFFFKNFNIHFYSGDVNSISIGSGTNIQDNSLVHVAKTNLAGKVLPTIIGDNVTVGE